MAMWMLYKANTAAVRSYASHDYPSCAELMDEIKAVDHAVKLYKTSFSVVDVVGEGKRTRKSRHQTYHKSG